MALEGLVTNFQSLSPKDVRLPQVCPGTKKGPHYSGEMKGGPSCQESGDELAPPQKTVSLVAVAPFPFCSVAASERAWNVGKRRPTSRVSRGRRGRRRGRAGRGPRTVKMRTKKDKEKHRRAGAWSEGEVGA